MQVKVEVFGDAGNLNGAICARAWSNSNDLCDHVFFSDQFAILIEKSNIEQEEKEEGKRVILQGHASRDSTSIVVVEGELLPKYAFGFWKAVIIGDVELSKRIVCGDLVRIEPGKLVARGFGREENIWGWVGEDTNVIHYPLNARDIIPMPRYRMIKLGFIEKFCELIRLKIASSVLIAGNRGSGKKVCVGIAAERFGIRLIRVGIREGLERLDAFFMKAYELRPAILLIENIDELIPKSKSTLTKEMISLRFNLISILSRTPKEVFIVATCSSFDSVDSSLEAKFSARVKTCPLSSADAFDFMQGWIDCHQFAEKVNNNVADLEDLSIYFQGLMLSELSSIMQKIEFCQFTDPKYRKKIAAIASSQKVNQGIPEELSKISWSDIAGLEDVKKRIEEMTIWPLKYPSIFEKNGIKPPKGILLCGPPGCGKTLIAKAIAGETLSRLFSVRISDAIKSHVGESEKFVSNLFERAKEAAPSVIFLDEFQAIFTSRESSSGSSSDKQITSQLMIEMDKLQFSNAPIVVLAATNVADAIDPAFKRPGRFDVIINVGLPDLTARKQLFMNLSRKMKFASNFDLQLLADLTEGSSGAQIKNLCQLAGLRALRRDPLAEHILVEDFMAELGRINALK